MKPTTRARIPDAPAARAARERMRRQQRVLARGPVRRAHRSHRQAINSEKDTTMHRKRPGRARLTIRYLWLGRALNGLLADRLYSRLSRYDRVEQAEDDYFRFANRGH